MNLDAILAILSDPKIMALLSPLLVGLLKRAIAGIPKWAMPLLSIVLGAALSAVTGGDLATGAVAGLAGIGVREALDQGKKAVTPTP